MNILVLFLFIAKENTSEKNIKSSRSRPVVELSPPDLSKDSHTVVTKKKKKTQSPVIAPSSPIAANVKNRTTTKGAPRITTTPVTAKNIRHRTVSSSSITTSVNKQSILPTTSKRKTVKTTDGLFLLLLFFKRNIRIMLVQPSRSKSSMARSTRLMNTTRRTIRRQTTYLSIPSIINGNSKGGQVLAVGENGMTQLGLKSSIDQRKNPQPVLIPELIVQIAAGPLHSVCLTNQNNIYTFGCNDEHALGRPDNDEDDDIDPFGEVDLSKIMNTEEENIVQIVAGDSHTLILSDIGKVYGRLSLYLK
jgi:regulator of chromosome condensation